MKNIILTLTLAMLCTLAFGQENLVTLSGGYAFANLEETDTDATGWRINGTYEFNRDAGKVSHGVSFGYIGTKTSTQTRDYKLSTWPIYYAPKFMFGKKSFKGFVKGALGMQWTGIKREGPAVEAKGSDLGLYAGAALGVTKSFNEKLFINLEYEWAYLSNSYYRDGFMNSAMVGIGLKF